MEAQQIFDKVSVHLLTQNSKSQTYVEEDGDGEMVCTYRDPAGRSCAVGCLIPDKYYTPLVEYQGVEGPDMILIVDKLNLREHLPLLVKLQFLHDTVPVPRWKENLLMIATSSGLSTKVLEEFNG